MLCESAEHGGNRQMQIPVQILILCIWMGSAKFLHEGFAKLSEKLTMHALNEIRGFGEGASYQLS